jgi:hypothetical protein
MFRFNWLGLLFVFGYVAIFFLAIFADLGSKGGVLGNFCGLALLFTASPAVFIVNPFIPKSTGENLLCFQGGFPSISQLIVVSFLLVTMSVLAYFAGTLLYILLKTLGQILDKIMLALGRTKQ